MGADDIWPCAYDLNAVPGSNPCAYNIHASCGYKPRAYDLLVSCDYNPGAYYLLDSCDYEPGSYDLPVARDCDSCPYNIFYFCYDEPCVYDLLATSDRYSWNHDLLDTCDRNSWKHDLLHTGTFSARTSGFTDRTDHPWADGNALCNAADARACSHSGSQHADRNGRGSFPCWWLGPRSGGTRRRRHGWSLRPEAIRSGGAMAGHLAPRDAHELHTERGMVRTRADGRPMDLHDARHNSDIHHNLDGGRRVTMDRPGGGRAFTSADVPAVWLILTRRMGTR